MSLQERLGSLSNVTPSDNTGQSPKGEEEGDSTTSPLIQRTSIIQKDERGYGFTVSGDKPVFVASVKPDGAAARAGVQKGDKIIKVNGKLVTNSNHTEVVSMIKAGSYVALTLFGKPASRDSVIDRDSTSSFRESGSYRDSLREKITGPQPVDAEKERELRQQRLNTVRAYYDAELEECEKLKKSYRSNPSDKLQTQIQEKEKTLKILEAQINPPSIVDPDSTSITSADSVSAWLPKETRSSKHVKHHSSSPGAMYRPSESGQPRASTVSRSKSDVSSRKNAGYEFPHFAEGYRRAESSTESIDTMDRLQPSKMPIRKTVSVPSAVSDISSISDSPHTSPSTSPTPIHYQNMSDTDLLHPDSGIEDGSQSSFGVSNRTSRPIIGMEDDDFQSDDESTGDSKIFSDLRLLETKPAHMAIFLHYVLMNHNPAPLLFYQVAGIYTSAQGSAKDLKKWAYEIHSTFIIYKAPLKINVDDSVINNIDMNLQYKSEKEDVLRALFTPARTIVQSEVIKLLEDLRQKKEQGLIEGSMELKDHMDKNEELKIVEKYLVPDLEKILDQGDSEDRVCAQGWALATFLRHCGLTKFASHSSVLERTQSFVSKDKKAKFLAKQKTTKSQKGHQFQLQHVYKQEFCMHCNKALWGVGFQGYQCQTCEQCVHKQCVDEISESCNKKKKRTSALVKPKQQATPIYPSNPSKEEPLVSPNPAVPTKPQPIPTEKDEELTAFSQGGHSVDSLVSRFNQYNSNTPETETVSGKPHFRRTITEFTPRHNRRNAISPRQNRRSSTLSSLVVPQRKGTEIGRSESMKGKGDRSDRPARRSKSDVDMDQNMLQAALTRSESSSTSSISNRSIESPSGSMDTLTAQIQDDSDFDVEPELPSLKEVLGDETVRKLKPKEKKRQDVINELFYTEKCHVRNLKIMDKLFYRPMLKDGSISQEFTKSLFPNLETMIQLHSSLNNKMKERRKEKAVISTVGDILLQRFDEEAGKNFSNGCAIFCRNQSHTLETLKVRVRKEPKLAQLLSDSESNPLCQRLALKDIIPRQFMRLTKYPLLIENLLKYTTTSTEEHSNLERALQCSKQILAYVNQAVRECENHQRLIDLQRRIEKKLDNSSDMEEMRTFDLSKHKLIHDGSLTWRINNRRQIELHVVLLESAMVLLQKQEDKLVLKQQGTQLVAGQDDKKRHSPLLWLNNVLARNDATDKRAFFVVNTSQSGPQIYQLVASSADEQKRWTKYITQAAEAQKKSDQNQKKNPAADKLNKVTEKELNDNTTPDMIEQDNEEEAVINVEDGLVHPDSVHQEFTEIGEAVPVFTTIDEKLRHNDEVLERTLEERQKLIGELLDVEPSDVPDKVKEIETEEGGGIPQDLIAACKQQTTQLYDIMKNAPHKQPEDSGDVVEDDISVPIPMDRLQNMACRMNQILTNLLAQTRATSASAITSPMSQAAVNSRDDERDRLRKELKYAQEELNRLRRIQKAAAPLLEKDLIAGRPASIVSEASTVSGESGDETKEGEQTDEQETETTEDSMPGLPVEIEPEPEIVTEILNESLNEVSPVTEDTIPDLDGEETTGTGILDEDSFDDVEDGKEEPLNEAEPPDEDEIEDDEPPDKQFDGIMGDQEVESDQESDTEGEEDEVNLDETDSVIPGTDLDKTETDTDKETDTDTYKTVTDVDGTHSDSEQGRTAESEDIKEPVSDNQSNDIDNGMKRDSSDEFQDAADKLDKEENSDVKGEKENGTDSPKETDVDEQISREHKHTGDHESGDLHDKHEGTPVDPVEPVQNGENVTESKDTSIEGDVNQTDGDNESQNIVTDIDHNSNIENQSVEDENADKVKTATESSEQDDVELRSDVTVTGLRTSTADTV